MGERPPVAQTAIAIQTANANQRRWSARLSMCGSSSFKGRRGGSKCPDYHMSYISQPQGPRITRTARTPCGVGRADCGMGAGHACGTVRLGAAALATLIPLPPLYRLACLLHRTAARSAACFMRPRTLCSRTLSLQYLARTSLPRPFPMALIF
jgi:hypothetical protein